MIPKHVCLLVFIQPPVIESPVIAETANLFYSPSNKTEMIIRPQFLLFFGKMMAVTKLLLVLFLVCQLLASGEAVQ